MADQRSNHNGEAHSTCLEEILDELKTKERETIKRTRRKTLLVSQASMRLIRQICEENLIARDALVEQIILSSKSCIEEIVQDMERRRREALELISPWLNEGREISNKIMKILDPQDPIIELFDRVYNFADNAGAAIKGEVRIGEQFDLIDK